MTARLYVGNLSYETDEQTLRDAFGADGRTVKDVHVMMDRETGRPRGFAFVEMANAHDAQAAIRFEDCHKAPAEARRCVFQVEVVEREEPFHSASTRQGGVVQKGAH